MIRPKYPASFERLWTVFPKKDGKAAALTAFKKLKVTAKDVDELIPCALKHARLWDSENRERKHKPSMGPWLNSDPLSAVIDLPETTAERHARQEKEAIDRRGRLSHA